MVKGNDDALRRVPSPMQAEALAATLHARGLRAGDVIAFQVPNWREAAVINLAAVIGRA